MARLLVSFVLVCFLNGCTNCGTVTFVRATPLNISKTNISNGSYQGDKYSTRIKIADKVNLYLIEYDKELRMHIEPSAGTKLRFETSEVLTNQVNDGETKKYKMSDISYYWFCNINDGEEKFCSASDASPTGKPTTIVSDDSSLWDNKVRTSHTRSFEATQEFTGQIKYDQTFFGHKPIPDGHLWFSVTLIEEPPINISSRIIKLPSLWIDNIKYELPNYKLETDTVEECSNGALGRSIGRGNN